MPAIHAPRVDAHQCEQAAHALPGRTAWVGGKPIHKCRGRIRARKVTIAGAIPTIRVADAFTTGSFRPEVIHSNCENTARRALHEGLRQSRAISYN